MGLIVRSGIFSPSRIVVDLLLNYGLAAFVDVHVPDVLLPWLMQLRQPFESGAAVGLSLEREARIAPHGIKMIPRLAADRRVNSPKSASSAMIIQATFNCQPGRLYAVITLCSFLAIVLFLIVVSLEKMVLRYERH